MMPENNSELENTRALLAELEEHIRQARTGFSNGL